MANTVGTIRAVGTISWTRAAVGWATRTIGTFAVAVLAAGYGIAIAIVYTSAKVVGVKTFIVGVAKPFAGALLVKVASYRWCAA